MRAAAAFATALVVVLVCATGAFAAPLSMTATKADTGWIDLHVSGRPGSTVEVIERVGMDAERVATVRLRNERALVRHALPWRCDRFVRHLEASAPGAEPRTLEGVVLKVRTRSCAHRLALSVRPAIPRAKRPVLVRVEDRWRVGSVRGRVCLTPRRGGSRCRPLRIRGGRSSGTVRVRTAIPGVGSIAVRPAWGGALRRTVDLRAPGRRLRLLATGDSMIQIIDGFLKASLADHGVAVQSDARISTGITKPFMLDWVALARRQALQRHPDVTVMFIGANDGFPIGRAQCCGRAWIDGYAARVRRMMRSYTRGGASRVYWLTLPKPRKPTFARVFRAVNAALRLAAPSLGDQGRLLDMGDVFTPHGQFIARYRQRDGVHLNVGGARIAAHVIATALRRDGITS